MLDDEIAELLGSDSWKFYRAITECDSYVEASNRMMMGRLNYNDHGTTHSKIVTRNSLKILDVIKDDVPLNIIKEGIGDLEVVKMVLIAGSYLHDIGNMIHREYHHVIGCSLALPLLKEALLKVYQGPHFTQILADMLHCIYSHDEIVRCITIEAGIVSVADGTDMEEGRARIPFEHGKLDIHSLSALSISKVEILRGEKKPLRIGVTMEDNAGIFQIQQVLSRKLDSSGLGEYVEIVAKVRGEEIRLSI